MKREAVRVGSVRGSTEEEIRKMGASGHSIWLVLDAETNRRASSIISRISNSFGTPRLKPHITLLGAIEGNEKGIREKASRLAKEIKPFEVTLTEVEHSDNYLKAIYSKVEEKKEKEELRKQNLITQVIDHS